MKTKQTKFATRIFAFSVVIAFLFICQISEAQIINTIAGDSVQGFSGDGGQATAAELNYPSGLAFDASGNLYIADSNNNRIRKISTSGVISTFAGNGTQGYAGDGGAATAAELNNPTGLAFDASGNLYIADTNNNCIRKINPSGAISTFAGNGTYGYAGDGGVASNAEFRYPNYIAIDNAGNFYISDEYNHIIRKINTSGNISTFAGIGSCGYSGDGGSATAAAICFPIGVTQDASGNTYISEGGGSPFIRKVNTSGIISTFAGMGVNGFSGDGGEATAATFYVISQIRFDAFGNLDINDTYNNVIRKVNTSGIITTIVGNHVQGFSGDGGSATSAELYYPSDIAFDASGNMYIADEGNNRIREVTGLTGINELSDAKQISVYPNPSNGIFTIVQKNNFQPLTFEVYNVLGEKIIASTFNAAHTQIDLSDKAKGIYLYRIIDAAGNLVKADKIVIIK